MQKFTSCQFKRPACIQRDTRKIYKSSHRANLRDQNVFRGTQGKMQKFTSCRFKRPECIQRDTRKICKSSHHAKRPSGGTDVWNEPWLNVTSNFSRLTQESIKRNSPLTTTLLVRKVGKLTKALSLVVIHDMISKLHSCVSNGYLKHAERKREEFFDFNVHVHRKGSSQIDRQTDR